jgi:H+/gluconate symporter-like permease
LAFVFRRLNISLSDVCRALAPSFWVTVASCLPPTAAILVAGGRFDVPLAVAVAAGCASGAFWMAAVYGLQHPVAAELTRAFGAARQRIGWTRRTA